MKFVGYIFGEFNPQFMEEGATSGKNSVDHIVITLIDHDDRRKLTNQIKHFHNKYTFSVSRAMSIHKNALNLKINLPRRTYTAAINRFLCCLSEHNLIYKKLCDFVNTKYIFECDQYEFQRPGNDMSHIYYTLTCLRSF